MQWSDNESLAVMFDLSEPLEEYSDEEGWLNACVDDAHLNRGGRLIKEGRERMYVTVRNIREDLETYNDFNDKNLNLTEFLNMRLEEVKEQLESRAAVGKMVEEVKWAPVNPRQDDLHGSAAVAKRNEEE